MCNPISTLYPDKLLEKGEQGGYEWEVTRNDHGYRCGYVRIPPGHPWHGKGIYEISPDVHGGLTFAEPDLNCGKGGADDAWWLGFDCAHAWDAPDPALPGYRPEMDVSIGCLLRGGPVITVKGTAYVKAECLSLIEQAEKAG